MKQGISRQEIPIFIDDKLTLPVYNRVKGVKFMRIDKSTYHLLTDHAIYIPKPDVKIELAISDAFEIMEHEHMYVELFFDNVLLLVQKKSTPESVLQIYNNKIRMRQKEQIVR